MQYPVTEIVQDTSHFFQHSVRFKMFQKLPLLTTPTSPSNETTLLFHVKNV